MSNYSGQKIQSKDLVIIVSEMVIFFFLVNKTIIFLTKFFMNNFLGQIFLAQTRIHLTK